MQSTSLKKSLTVKEMLDNARDILIFIIENRNWDLPYLFEEETVKTLALNVQTSKWSTILLLFGNEFLVAVLEFYERQEDFERCAEILSDIKEYSGYLKVELHTHHTQYA